MRSEIDVSAELAQERALVAGERLRLRARGDQRTEHCPLREQRRDDEGTQPRTRKTLRKVAFDAPDVRLINELPLDAGRQSVAVDDNALVLRHRQLFRQRLAGRCGARDGPRARLW